MCFSGFTDDAEKNRLASLVEKLGGEVKNGKFDSSITHIVPRSYSHLIILLALSYALSLGGAWQRGDHEVAGRSSDAALGRVAAVGRAELRSESIRRRRTLRHASCIVTPPSRTP